VNNAIRPERTLDMRTTSTPGFDLRDAIDGLRDMFDPTTSGRSASERTAGRDIRAAILTELSVEPMHGYQIIRAIEARSGGTWTPTAGSVYPTLQLLADEDLVTAAQVGERKVYSLTDAGRAVAAEVTDSEKPQDSQRSRRTDDAVALTKSSVKLASAVTQVVHNGTPEQSARAAVILDEARRKVYAILAED
jgi:DNA-binding PadR family transcriptional regulator